MTADYHRILFVFVDGVGLAPASPDNPLSTVAAPTLRRLLDGPLTSESVTERPGLLLAGIDARLGVEGLPQSATGQATLFTGINGAELLGRHQTAFPGATLRAVIETDSVFVQLARAGRTGTFANAYSDEYLERLAAGNGRASVTTRAMLAAGLPFRRIEELRRGDALTWDIERDLFVERTGVGVERVDARLAGSHLASIAERHDLTLFETFLTDVAGHRRWNVTAAEAIRRVDDLLDGVVRADTPGLTWVLTSDHGNLEDATTRGHTLNPVPLLVHGPLAARFAGVRSIEEITPRIVDLLDERAATCQADVST